MQKPKVKLKSRLSRGKLKEKALRLLKADVWFQAPSTDQERIAHVPTPVDSYYNQREIRNAYLNTEHKKAQGLMESQNRRFTK